MSERFKNKKNLWTHLLVALGLVVLSIGLISCTSQSSTTPTTRNSTRPAATSPTQPTTTNPTQPTTTSSTQSNTSVTSRVSGTGDSSGTDGSSGVPVSWAHLTIGGALNGMLTITGEAANIPIESGQNPYQLSFILRDVQAGTALDMRVHNYVGPGSYTLYGGYGDHDDLGVWTGGGANNLWNLGSQVQLDGSNSFNPSYPTGCQVDVDSDTPTQYGSLHEVKGFFSCDQLYLAGSVDQAIACSGHFDVFVNVPE